MTLKIYGISTSRAIRPLWTAEELGLRYEHVPLPYQGGATHTPEFLDLNPNGHIPVLDDEGIIVWESMACALYLARRYGGQGQASLAPLIPREEAEVLRWTFWAVTEVEKDALTVLMHLRGMAPEQRKPELAQAAERRLLKPLAVLENHLQQNAHVAGERFTVADVTLASVVNWTRASSTLLAQSPRVLAWLKDCIARPAYQRAKALP